MQSDFILEVDSSWSLFLDRDGVINERIIGGYVQYISSFHVLEGVPEAIAVFKEIFGHIFVVTNQQGIGKKIMTTDELQLIHDYMESKLSVKFNGIYYCPSLASENSLMRKPNPGMAIQAKKDYPEIDFKKSIMVGDSVSDIEFGRNLDMKTVYISDEEKTVGADMVCASLYDFAEMFLNRQ